MFTQPGTPNLVDYLAFLAGIGIPPANATAVFPLVNGNATGGDTDTLTDLTQNWLPNQWVGYAVLDVTQNVLSWIASNDAVDLSLVTPLNNPMVAGDNYQIAPAVAVNSLSIAIDIVNTDLNMGSAQLYTLAVYNLAADRLINYAQDVPGQTFFLDMRGPKGFRISDVRVGVPSSSNDQGVGVGILNPEQMKWFTLQDLQTLKTPPGRRYMEIAQAIGVTLYGVS